MNFENLLNICDAEKDFYGATLRQGYEDHLPLFERFRNGDHSLNGKLMGMIENSLTEEEAFYILNYTAGGAFSKWINFDLRAGRTPKTICKKNVVEKLNSSLRKVKSFDENIVFRMDKPYSSTELIILNWFSNKVGTKFKIPYFLSTAKINYNNTKIVWQIKTLPENSLGKDISNIANNPDEFEVLFQLGSCFEIISVNFDKSIVYLNEILPTIKTDFELIDTIYII